MTARLIAVLAVLFGVVTIAVGTRVLAGADPGYVVFRPLLIFNTIMGLVYVLAGAVIWRDVHRGRLWARSIALVNLVVLLAIVALFVAGSSVAVDSLAAMTVRTVAWGAAAWMLGRSR